MNKLKERKMNELRKCQGMREDKEEETSRIKHVNREERQMHDATVRT